VGFTGKWLDRATDLQWNHNRWYNASIGRWMSQDPIGFAGGDGNLSRYVGNAPTMAIDPDGLWLEWAVSPIRSFREWRRGVALDRRLDELEMQRAQAEIALCPTSDQGERTLRLLQQRQRERAVNDATSLANFNYQFSGIGFGGTFIRPGAGLVRTPNKTRLIFDGLEVRAVRDLSHVDETTLRAMAQSGFAPKDPSGRTIILHHLKQNPTGPICEMPASRHNIHNTVQHPLGNSTGAGLSSDQRSAFNAWRESYWKARAEEELKRRGLKL
jgi:RHS repeat-associated protein